MGYLLIGSSGFLGSRILEYLNQKGKVVTTTKEISQKINNSFLEKNFYDLDDKDLEELVLNFHTIIDASGISKNKNKFEFEDYLKSNSIWPYRLARACVKSKVKLIWFSSIHCEKYQNQNFEKNMDKYSLSKFLGESLIKAIANWYENILIIRLGNILGAPGKSYSGNSELFSIDIVSSLIKTQKAYIKNKENVLINITCMKDLLEIFDTQICGHQKLCSDFSLKLTEIASSLKFIYEKKTGEKVDIFHNDKVVSLNNELIIDKKIIYEMEELINFFIKKDQL